MHKLIYSSTSKWLAPNIYIIMLVPDSLLAACRSACEPTTGIFSPDRLHLVSGVVVVLDLG